MITFILFIIHIILLAALIYIWTLIIRLIINPHFRECPPFIPSFGKQKKFILARMKDEIEKKGGNISILDPGCGIATLLISLAKKYPDCNFVGIEWRKITAKIAQLRTHNLKNVKIVCQDFFDYPFNDFQIIVCFLMQPIMQELGEKIKNECQSGTIVISNTFYFPQIKPDELIKINGLYKFNDVYIYKF